MSEKLSDINDQPILAGSRVHLIEKDGEDHKDLGTGTVVIQRRWKKVVLDDGQTIQWKDIEDRNIQIVVVEQLNQARKLQAKTPQNNPLGSILTQDELQHLEALKKSGFIGQIYKRSGSVTVNIKFEEIQY